MKLTKQKITQLMPPGANPYHYDGYGTGTDIPGSERLHVMNSGTKDGSLLRIIDRKTGKVLDISLELE